MAFTLHLVAATFSQGRHGDPQRVPSGLGPQGIELGMSGRRRESAAAGSCGDRGMFGNIWALLRAAPLGSKIVRYWKMPGILTHTQFLHLCFLPDLCGGIVHCCDIMSFHTTNTWPTERMQNAWNRMEND